MPSHFGYCRFPTRTAIPLECGRYFSDDDRAGVESVVILSNVAARMYFGSDDPIGRVVEVAAGARRVVGVVANARQASLEVSPHPEVYLPMAQGRDESYGFVLLHTSGDPNNALPALRAVVAQVLPGGAAAADRAARRSPGRADR
jgi:hypothetical protein